VYQPIKYSRPVSGLVESINIPLRGQHWTLTSFPILLLLTKKTFEAGTLDQRRDFTEKLLTIQTTD